MLNEIFNVFVNRKALYKKSIGCWTMVRLYHLSKKY